MYTITFTTTLSFPIPHNRGQFENRKYAPSPPPHTSLSWPPPIHAHCTERGCIDQTNASGRKKHSTDSKSTTPYKQHITTTNTPLPHKPRGERLTIYYKTNVSWLHRNLVFSPPALNLPSPRQKKPQVCRVECCWRPRPPSARDSRRRTNPSHPTFAALSEHAL